MKKEILTYPLSKEQIDKELAFFAQYFIESGHKEFEILFGYAWGNEYYDTNEWNYETIEIEQLVNKVTSLEAKGFGVLGCDDLFIKIPGQSFDFRFCNDSDIHISFKESNSIIEDFYNRWKALGYSPAEWAEGENNKKQRVRIN